MRIVKTLAAAATIAALSTSAFAGGIAPVVVEPTVEVMEPAKTSSVKPGYIVLGVVAALLIAAAAEDE